MALPEKRDELRVGDAERDAVVAQLRTHLGAGRLTIEEFEERTGLALAARTTGDLVPLTSDLPAVRPMPAQKGPPIRVPARQPAQGWELAWRIHRNLWLAVTGLCVLIWLLTTPTGYFWPVWVALGMGASVAIHSAVKRAVEG